jgi:hypothetical protein
VEVKGCGMVFHKILLGWAMLRTIVEDLNLGSMDLTRLRYLQQHF